jgi:hypothetical protein
MAEQTPTQSTPERPKPPAWANRLISGILRSPLHGLLSKEMMLITFTGRKSGKKITTPVTMIPTGDGVKFFCASPWYKNLVGGAPVSVVLAGRERAGQAAVVEDPEALLRETKDFIAKRGLKNAFRIGLQLDAKNPPTDADLAGLLKGRAMITVALT